jgi:hypothetical protein
MHDRHRAERDDKVLALDITKVTKPCSKRLHAGCGISSSTETQVADACNSGWLLRTHPERLCHRTTNKRNELMPLHPLA